MEKLDLSRKSLKKFGVIMGIALLALSVLISLKDRGVSLPALFASAVFFIFSAIAPQLLRPLYVVWMKLAFILGWVNTRIILVFIFYLTFTPIGLVIKLLRLDLLEQRIDKEAKSYWKKKEPELELSGYERQF